MAAYARAHVIKNALVTIDEVEFKDQVTKARLVPDTPTQTLRTVGGSVIKDTDTTAWTLELSGVQDYGAGGLAAKLLAESGNQVEAVIQPKSGTGQDEFTVTFVAAPVDMGGEAGQFRTFEATFEVVDQPAVAQTGA